MDAARYVWEGEIAMTRKFLSRGIVAGALVATLTGCESLRSTIRHKDNDEVASKDDDSAKNPEAVTSDTSKIKSVDSTDKNSSPFFNPTRARSAFTGFSPEAQQIEKDLGVY
jgi:hypothetical protein